VPIILEFWFGVLAVLDRVGHPQFRHVTKENEIHVM
jgi:hypothetical protein